MSRSTGKVVTVRGRRSPYRPRMLGALGMGLLLVLAACAGGADGAADTADADAAAGDGGEELQEVSLRFNISAYAPHIPFVYAQELGFYEEEGLTVTFGEGTGSETTGALVAEGDDTFGTVDIPAVTSLVGEGAPISAVAIIEQRSPLAVISLADSGIEEPEDLHGRTVVMEGGDLESFESFVQVAGIDIDQIETLTMADSAQAAALESGQVDGIFGWTTSQGSETVELSGGIQSLLFADYGYDLLNLTLVANTETIEDDPELVCSFVRASFRGWEATQEDTDDAIETFIEYFPNVNPNIADWGLEQQLQLLQAEDTEGEPLGFVTPDMVDATLEVLAGVGAVDEGLAAEDIYNPMCFE